MITSPRNRGNSSTPNSSPDTSPKKREEEGEGATSEDATSHVAGEGGPKKAVVIVPSGNIVKETPEPSSVNEKNDDTNVEVVPMETEELPLESGDPAGGDTVSHEDVEVSVEENRAGQFNQTSASSPASSSSTSTNTTSLSSSPGSSLEETSASSSSSSSSPSTNTCDTQLGKHDTDNLSNSNNVGNSSSEDTSSGSESPGEGERAGPAERPPPSRPDSLPVEDFNSFTFWRDPLPEIDIDADLSPSSQEAALRAAQARAQASRGTGAEGATGGERLDEAAKAIEILSLNGSGEAADPGAVNTVHVASVVTAEAAEEETVTNIGSTHVLGQHPRETTMTVINGVVKGKLQRVMGWFFLPSRLRVTCTQHVISDACAPSVSETQESFLCPSRRQFRLCYLKIQN